MLLSRISPTFVKLRFNAGKSHGKFLGFVNPCRGESADYVNVALYGKFYSGCFTMGQDQAVDQVFNLNTEKVSEADFETAIQVAPTATVRSVLSQLQEENSGSALVCESGKLVGIFTERDALKLIAGSSDFEQAISEVMIPNPKTLSTDDKLSEAVKLMASGGYRRLPVVNDSDEPVGVLTTSGILHHLVDHFSSVVYTLPPAPHHSTQEREGA